MPFAMMLQQSFKDNKQFFTSFWLPTLPLHFENYTKAFPIIYATTINTLMYAIPTLFIVLTVSGLTGFAFARYNFPGKNFIFLAMLLLIMLPGILLVIPMFVQMVDLAGPTAFRRWCCLRRRCKFRLACFSCAPFLRRCRAKYFEAARIDGASEGGLFLRIALPLALPAVWHARHFHAAVDLERTSSGR